MKALKISLILLLSQFIASCDNSKNSDLSLTTTDSKIIVKVQKATSSNGQTEDNAFTGNDIEWFNGTTRELQFKNNMKALEKINQAKKLLFYIGDQYLFEGARCVNGQQWSYAIYDLSLNTWIDYDDSKEVNGEEITVIKSIRFFLDDSYPAYEKQFSEEGNQQVESNREKRAGEWQLFLNQLKKEGKFIEK